MKSEPRPINVAMLKQAVITKEGYIIYGDRRLIARNLLGQKLIRTPSERVAIGKAVEAEIQNLKDQMIDPRFLRHAGAIAAAEAGFDSKHTYELAKKVVEKGIDEIVAKMDSGDLTIVSAAMVADEPPEEQRKIAKSSTVWLHREVVRLIQKRYRIARQNTPVPPEWSMEIKRSV